VFAKLLCIDTRDTIINNSNYTSLQLRFFAKLLDYYFHKSLSQKGVVLYFIQNGVG